MANNLYLGNGDWATTKGSTLFYTVENGIYEGVPSEVIRNSEATTLNKDGVLETVDVDTSAIDYTNSANGALRLEDESTNLFLHSEDFSNAYWGKNNGLTFVDISGTDPDGSDNANNINVNSGRLNKDQNTTIGEFYTMSFYCKGVVGETIYTNLFGVLQEHVLDGSWQRIERTKQANASFSTVAIIDNRSNGNAQNISLWGAQFEESDFATSYMESGVSIGTRGADSLINVGREELFNSTEGVLHVEFSTNIPATAQGVYVSLSNNTSSNRIYTGFVSGNLIAKIQNSVDNQTLTKTGLDIKQTQSVAIYYKDGGFRFYVNGILEQSFNYSGTFLPFNRLGFDSGTGVFNFFYGSVPKLVVYKSIQEAQKDLTYIL